MKKIMILMFAASAMLTGCHTTKSILTNDYDERPENKQPVLERPAWPNYDLHDDRSFAAFSHIQTAPEGEGVRLIEDDGSVQTTRTTLYRCKDATYLCYDYHVPDYQDWWFFRQTSGSAIIDADTGDRYVVQGHEHFPLDQCFWIYGQKGETIRLVAKYPPLPLSVKRVQIYEASAEPRRWMSGTGSLSKVYNLDDLRPHPQKQEKEAKQQHPRIIR